MDASRGDEGATGRAPVAPPGLHAEVLYGVDGPRTHTRARASVGSLMFPVCISEPRLAGGGHAQDQPVQVYAPGKRSQVFSCWTLRLHI